MAEQLSTEPAVKVTANVKNFSAGNTPETAQAIGDWALRIAAAAIIIGGAIAAPPIGLAVLGGQIIGYAGVAGTLIKSLTKLFGKIDASGNQTIGEKQ